MSDNIDYDELDKAVFAAINARQTTKAPVKPVAKPAPKAPVRRGMFMDFAPVNARKTVVRRSVETRTVVATPRPAAPARPAARVAANPAAKVAPAISRPKAAAPIARPRPGVHPTAKPLIRPAQAPKLAAKPVAKPVAKPAPKPAPKPVEEEPKPILAKKPAAKTEEKAPNANNYSLGVRSPFMKSPNVKVEKRPLGNNIPEASASSLRSTHNVYSQKSALKNTEAAQKHIITQGETKKSGWLWTLIVIAVIAAGGGLGYLAYLLVFAK